ncbi:hypothetical protein [Candidatus Symbiopectobacterium sp. 'North America']|uniref:hypothetical protein n=1 Tax=Candidatus Symbiopectobacterium sp. 'North America' TaxID=2794574 RepID=UPI0018CB2164
MNNVQAAIRNAQAEIIAIMTDAGIATDAGKSDQLLAALKKTFALNASPVLTGNPTAPTQPKADNSTKLATTGHVKLVAADYAPLANSTLSGKPTAPTAAQTSNDKQLATTAFVKAAVAALVDSSPSALDTLNELAAALGDDECSFGGQSATGFTCANRGTNSPDRSRRHELNADCDNRVCRSAGRNKSLAGIPCIYRSAHSPDCCRSNQ